jgi:hypothetical protein
LLRAAKTLPSLKESTRQLSRYHSVSFSGMSG